MSRFGAASSAEKLVFSKSAIRLHPLAELRVIPSESMRKWLVFLLAGGVLQAAIIKGSVAENQTGKALARTLVSIQPLPGSAGPTGTVRTNSYGMFEFIDLPAGAYLIQAARRGFMPAQYGQKNWRAAGQPVVLDKHIVDDACDAQFVGDLEE